MKISRRTLINGAAVAASVGAGGGAGAQPQRTRIVPFAASAFPYDGIVPETGLPFLDVEHDGARGHASPRGGVYLEDPTYSDRRVLLHVAPGFGPASGGVLVVFFHGNGASLGPDVVARQAVVTQFDAARLPGALVAPQLAVSALDSSAGNFWEPGFFRRFVEEAGHRLGRLSGLPAAAFNTLPIVLAAYSGGYHPLAYALSVGGATERIIGVLLFDGLFGDFTRFADWIGAAGGKGFFVSAHGAACAAENATMKQLLRERGLRFQEHAPARLSRGTWFIEAPEAEHDEFMTKAWVENPLADLLARVG